jgi:16S rRNA (uracil1498-N3)-methyltransferase
MHYFYQPEITHGANYLEEEESKHCIRVLRHKKGDQLAILDGKGNCHTVRLIDDNPKKCQFELLHKVTLSLPSYAVHLAIAPTKNTDRMEWMVEKCTELGIHSITFIETEHTEKKGLKIERLAKKAISALKQSYSGILPEILGPVKFSDYLNHAPSGQRFIAYVDEGQPDSLWNACNSGRDTTIMIGPEGDFSMQEIEHALSKGYQKVSLGKTRLRTETAGLVACHTIHLKNEA